MSNTSSTESPSVHVRRGNERRSTEVPIWIQSYALLAPPKAKPSGGPAVVSAVAMLMAAADGLEINRGDIGLAAGYSGPQAAKRAGWIIDYLQSIDAVHVEKRQRGDKRGRDTDVIVIFTDEPDGYCGPRTATELRDALRSGERPAMLSVDISPGQTQGSSSRTLGGDQGSRSRTKVDKTPGQTQGSSSRTLGGDQGSRSRTKVDKTPGQTQGSSSRTFSDLDLIFSFGEGGEDQMERASAGAPEAPASPAGTDEHDEAARQLVAAAPWSDVANRQGQDISASTADLDRLHSAIATSLREGRVDVAMAADVLAAALAKAKNSPVAYAAGAFEPKQLGQWVRSLTTITLASPTPVASEHVQAKSTPRSTSSLALPACSTCGANEGEGLAVRQYDGEDGRAYPCPCRTATAA